MNTIKQTASIILAGGKGVRMQSELPKVLQPLCEQPLIRYVIESLKKAGVDDITVVVGYKGELVIDVIKDDAHHVWQYEQLGTGHAVMQAEECYRDFDGNIIVACGDVPLIKSETFNALISKSADSDVKATVLTMLVDNPQGYGRILKKDGIFTRIVEEKDATENEKKIKEVNTGTYIFDGAFLFEGLKRIDTNNAQGEYYLPDALQYIIESGYTVNTLLLDDPMEGTGLNTKSELESLERYLKNKNK